MVSDESFWEREEREMEEMVAAMLLAEGYVYEDPLLSITEALTLRLIKKTRSTVHEEFIIVVGDDDFVWDVTDAFSPDPAFAESQLFGVDAEPGPIEYYRREIVTDLDWPEIARLHLEGRTRSMHRTVIDVPE